MTTLLPAAAGSALPWALAAGGQLTLGLQTPWSPKDGHAPIQGGGGGGKSPHGNATKCGGGGYQGENISLPSLLPSFLIKRLLSTYRALYIKLRDGI